MPTTVVGSHTVYYDDCGSGHPLLLISGLGSTRLGWWKQVGPFSRQYRVLNMDNRDAGDSALGAGPYTIADMAGDTAGLIQNLGLAPAHIVAISMGGMIALELAVRHPELVDKLVLIATSAGGPGNVSARPEIAALLVRSAEEDLETRVRRTFTAIAGEGYMASNPHDLDQIVRNALAKRMSVESYGRQLTACIGHALQGVAGRLEQITAPTLVVHGTADPLVPFPNGEYLASHIPGALFSPHPGVGHLVPIEDPEQFNREVMDFLG